MRSVLVCGLVVSAVLSPVGVAQAATAQQKCQKAKLTAASKLRTCLNKQRNNVLIGKADDSAECQTKFQTALTKADTKAAAAATSCRYIDNLDGTVSDLNTGLVWEQKTASGTHNVSTIYTWASSGTTPNGTAFTGLLGTLNGGTSSDGSDTPTPCFTGHCDWRLPTVQELAGILDLTQGSCGGGSGACIQPAFGPTQANVYWSATTRSSDPTFAWGVAFFIGFVDFDPKVNSHNVRAVRGGL